MPRFVPLADTDRQTFRDLQSLTGLSQKEVADRITTVSITQPWISQMLGGSRPSVDPEILEAYVNQLVLALRNRTIDERFSAETRREAFSFLGRFTQSPALKDPVESTRPGGGVPPDAFYYQSPPDQAAVLEALTLTPFTMLMMGPVQTGKSSLIARLERRAKSMGFETAWFDPIVPFGHLRDLSERPIVPAAFVASALYEQVQDQWSLEPRKEGTPATIPHLLNWFRRVLKPAASKPRLLILDDLSSLGLDGAEEWTSFFVRALHNYARAENIDLSLVVGMNYGFGAQYERRITGISSIVHWDPRITLDWLSRESADNLVHTLDRSALRDDEPYKHFLGQPYLTHAFASDKEFQNAAKGWFDHPEEQGAILSLRRSKIYRRHLAAIRATFAEPFLQVNSDSETLLADFAKLSNLNADNSENDGKRKFLRDARLIKPHATEYMIPLYKLISQDLLEKSLK